MSITKTIAENAINTGVANQIQLKNTARPRQHGVTLIELMVGLAIGLLVVAVAMGAMMISRGISGTVSDASNIQQQGAYAMRVFGTQLRQAGSIYLNLNPQNITGGEDELVTVGLQFNRGDGPAITIDSGNMQVGYTRYTEPVFISTTEISLARNCIGAPQDASTDNRIENTFNLSGTELICGGNGTAAQPIINNVRNFQVRYLQQDNNIPSNAKIKYVNSTIAATWDVSEWDKVQGVEICLVLFGNERIDIPSGSTYKDCDGVTDKAYIDNKMHMVFRNVFQLRSQGLMGSF